MKPPRCPHCNARRSRVVGTRERKDGAVYRRHHCLGCKKSFSSTMRAGKTVYAA